MATVQGLGVHLDRRVTGTLDEVVIAPELAEAIRSDPAAFRQFVGQQVMNTQVTGTLFAFVPILAMPRAFLQSRCAS
jgi:hypothetical protein